MVSNRASHNAQYVWSNVRSSTRRWKAVFIGTGILILFAVAVFGVVPSLLTGFSRSDALDALSNTEIILSSDAVVMEAQPIADDQPLIYATNGVMEAQPIAETLSVEKSNPRIPDDNEPSVLDMRDTEADIKDVVNESDKVIDDDEEEMPVGNPDVVVSDGVFGDGVGDVGLNERADSFELEDLKGMSREDSSVIFEGGTKYMRFVEDVQIDDARAALLTPRQLENSKIVTDYGEFNHLHGPLGTKLDGTDVFKYPPMPKPYASLSSSEQSVAVKNGGFYLEMSNALSVDRVVTDNREAVCKNAVYSQIVDDVSVVITFFNEPISTLFRTVYSVLNYTPPEYLREIILVNDHSEYRGFHIDSLYDEMYPFDMAGLKEAIKTKYDHLSRSALPSAIPLEENPYIMAIDYIIQHLPKVKLINLHERSGIVRARIHGAKLAEGSVSLILDSHVEVGPGWVEPMLGRIAENPKAIMMPQIRSMDSTNFEYMMGRGIGCIVDWRWSMVEYSKATMIPKSSDPIASPSMAGGLFAVRTDWFFEVGAYDDGFTAWGAENVEMPFRTWMCGGAIECAPCSNTYHIYRKGGSGYSNPPGALWINRMRTARTWLDGDHYEISAAMIDASAGRPPKSHKHDDSNIAYGDVSKMLELKDRLQCKNFEWYLDNVSPTHDGRRVEDVKVLGRIGHFESNMCVDTKGKRAPNDIINKSYPCHSLDRSKRTDWDTLDRKTPFYPTGTQGFYVDGVDKRVRLMANDKRCLSPNGSDKLRGKLSSMKVVGCNDSSAAASFEFRHIDIPVSVRITGRKDNKQLQAKIMYKNKCLLVNSEASGLGRCDSEESWLDVDEYVPLADRA